MSIMTINEMFHANGYDVYEVRGEKRYVTRDEKGRAVVGPRRRGGRGVMAFLHPRGNGRKPVQVVEAEYYGGDGQEPQENWAQRAKRRWLERWYNPEWHKAVQHTALDLAIWAPCLALAAVSLKGAWWVVTL